MPSPLRCSIALSLLLTLFILLPHAASGQLRLDLPSPATIHQFAPGESIELAQLRITASGDLGPTDLQHYTYSASFELAFTLLADNQHVFHIGSLFTSCLAREKFSNEAYFDCRPQVPQETLQIPKFRDDGLYRLVVLPEVVTFLVEGPNSPSGDFSLTISQDNSELFFCTGMIGLVQQHRFCPDPLQPFPAVDIGQVRITDPRPDLSVDGLEIGGTPFPGATLQVRAAISNPRNSPTPTTHGEFLLTDQPGQAVFARRVILLHPLAPMESRTVETILRIPPAVAEYWIEFRADPFQRINEVDEENNMKDLQLFLEPVPACDFTDCSLQSTISSISQVTGTPTALFTAVPGVVGCTPPSDVTYTWWQRRRGSSSWGDPAQIGPNSSFSVPLLAHAFTEVRARMVSGPNSCEVEAGAGGTVPIH